MLIEVQAGTYLDPNDVVAITEDYVLGYAARKMYNATVALRNGLRFEVGGKRADEVAALLWPNDKSPTRLAE